MEVGEAHGSLIKTSAFCWGSTTCGQLGLGGIETEQILEPLELKALRNRKVAAIACGEAHTVFLMHDGTLYSCGNNDCGQLGQDKARRRPEQISHLETQVIHSVACGYAHCLAVNSKGQVFSWGDNRHCQLGQDAKDARVPKVIRSLSSHTIVQVACGSNHNLALSNNGQLFSWGSNTHGQLGVGNRDSTTKRCNVPHRLSSLQGLAVSQVAAGADHSFALTVSGALFGWGKNSFGQLGIGSEQDCYFPSLVKTLRSQRVKYVACGQEHTAVLTQDGGVFTFGAGMYGQLGHGSCSPETLPRKVFELMGSVVTQLACGRHHTMAYVSSSRRLYSFGLGGNGQLGGASKDNCTSPVSVKAPFLSQFTKLAAATDVHPNSEPPYLAKHVYAGGDQSFVTVTSSAEGVTPDDCRVMPCHSQILSLSIQRIDAYSMIPVMQIPPASILEEVDKIFSSPSCMNGSFLLPDTEHCCCSGRHSGVDVDCAKDMFGRMAKLPNPRITEKMVSAIESLLCDLSQEPPDQESIRLYLTLPMCHAFEQYQRHVKLHCEFAKAVLGLTRIPSRVIDLWWGKLHGDHFLRLVKIYKQTVVHLLYQPNAQTEYEIVWRQQRLLLCLNLLKKLNKINDEQGLPFPYDAFYITELGEKVDIRADFVQWLQQHRTQGSALYCNYPFVFDGPAKTLLLQTEAIIQMQVAVDEVQRRNINTLFLPIDPVNPCLVLYVSRDNIIHDTLNQLAKAGTLDFKKPLKVMFVSEDAIDAGGVRKEFFMLLLREILDPKFGMFRYYEESRLLWFSSESFEEDSMYLLIGVLCGLAIYNSTIIDLHFPLALYKKLLKRTITLDDLKILEPSVGKSLQDLLDYDGDDLEEVFCLTFEVVHEMYGEIKHVELYPGSSDIPVTKDNRKDYVDIYIDYVFNKSVEKSFRHFDEGFHKVCGGKVLELFHPQELQAMVIGNENYNWEEFETNTEYKGEYHRNHQTIKNFWETFREMAHADKKNFLMFLTGSDRIPIHGMKAIKMVIQPTGGGDTFLPVAHTCFNLLDLPKYKSGEALREKLLIAIQHTQGFGLV